MSTTNQSQLAGATPFPPQHQAQQPGIESLMNPRPLFDNPLYKAAGKLENKVAIITGGDSGIGRAVAVAYAREGADVAIVYFNEHEDAKETKKAVSHMEGVVLPLREMWVMKLFASKSLTKP